mgnify:CR=1 FL=1
MKNFLGVAVLALGLSAPVAANASTVFFDDFNSNAADQLNGTPSGWSNTSGIADIIGAGGGFDWYPGNGSYLDLDGSRGALGQDTTLVTNSMFNLGPGTYTFSIDYGINHNDGGDSDWIEFGILGFLSNTVDANALSHTGSTFSNSSFIITLASAVNGVRFFIHGLSAGGPDRSGGLVDNFKVSTVSAVPLPGAALLLASGLFGLGGVSRFRRKA